MGIKLNHFAVTLLPEFCFFRNRFQRNIWAEKSKDECSKTIKPISKFLSHIKSTWIKLQIHNTFTKFSKSWHRLIPFKFNSDSEALHAQECTHMNVIAFLLHLDLKKKKKCRHVTNIDACTLLCCDYSTLWEALHVNMVEIGARFSDENVKILVSYQWIGWKRRTKMVGE